MARQERFQSGRSTYRALGTRNSAPIVGLVVAGTATGVAVVLAPRLAAATLLVGSVGLLGVWAILRFPRAALNSSFFFVLVAWTKFRYRDPAATLAGEVDWQIGLELGLYALLALVALRALSNSAAGLRRARGIDLWVAGYIALVLASVFWSPIPRITAVRAVQLTIQAGLVLATVMLLGRAGLLRNLSSAILAYVLVFGLAALLVPGARGAQVVEGGVGRFYWFSMHPGTVAAVAAIAGLFVLARILFEPGSRGRLRREAPLVLALLVLVLVMTATRVRGQTIAFVAAGGMLLTLRYARSWTIALVASAALLVAAVILSFPVSADEILRAGESSGNPLVEFVYRGQSASKLTTLSSRVDLWKVAFSLVQERPVLGHGYVASRIVLIREVPWAAYAHNAWFQALLDLGVVGLACVLVLVLSPLRVLREQGAGRREPSAAAIASVTAFLLITSITSEGFAGAPGLETLVIFALALGAARAPLRSGVGEDA